MEVHSFQSGLLILAMFHSLDTWLCLEQRGYHLQGCDMLLVRFEFWGQVASGSPFTAALMPLPADLALARILIRSPFTAPCPSGPISGYSALRKLNIKIYGLRGNKYHEELYILKSRGKAKQLRGTSPTKKYKRPIGNARHQVDLVSRMLRRSTTNPCARWW